MNIVQIKRQMLDVVDAHNDSMNVSLHAKLTIIDVVAAIPAIASIPELVEALEDLLIVLAEPTYHDYENRLASHIRIANKALKKVKGE